MGYTCVISCNCLPNTFGSFRKSQSISMLRMVSCETELMNKEVQYQESFIINSRGVKLFTCRWLPIPSPKALVFLCHGYGMECSGFMRGCGNRLASAGYGVFGVDYEGHGRSSGARCYVEKFENIVDDCFQFFSSISGGVQREAAVLVLRIYGRRSSSSSSQKECLFLGRRCSCGPVAPMCKISEKLKPHPMAVNLLTRVEAIIPKWKIVPTKDVIDSAFKDPAKREEVRKNKLIYQGKPRLKTALEMLRASTKLENSLQEVTFPFLVLHGEADTVTDPEVSKALYEKANSRDKTMRLYAGMWHGLTFGEPDENVQLVFSDIVAWLDKRTSGKLNSSEQDRGLSGQSWTGGSKPHLFHHSAM